MNVYNEHLKEMLFVTPHAKTRWHERGGSDLHGSVRQATPFGAQVGNGMLLEFNGLVFAISWDERGAAVTTVLTIEQAIANVQATCRVPSRRQMKKRRAVRDRREEE